MKNDQICPEDKLLILLSADKIPDRATVSKRTGTQELTLCRNLVVYIGQKTEDNKMASMTVEGYFLIGPRGSINQIQPSLELHWHVVADELVDELQRSWNEETPQ